VAAILIWLERQGADPEIRREGAPTLDPFGSPTADPS
jgi:hypothetical protein